MSTNPGEDQFLEEVIGLFALEAQEWLGQINGALGELQSGPDVERTSKLFEIILRGLTNLGGSAATVELTSIEQVALAMMPLIQGMQARGGATVEQIAAVQAGLDAITSVIQTVGETGGKTAGDVGPVVQRLTEAATAAPAPVEQARPSTPEVSTSGGTPAQKRSLLDALLDLRAGAQTGDPSRNTVELVLQKVREGIGEHASVESSTVQGILRDLAQQDEQFLAELDQRLPRIVQIFPVFKPGETESWQADGQVEPVLQDIRSLQESAHAVRATAMMLFFAGLETFIRIAAARKVPIVPERFDAVESRLGTIAPLAQEWSELGRRQRASIEHIL